MIYGSVCSGIEAATVAWEPIGWKLAFFSEIKKFPRAVLAHHYPAVPLHGDFTTIKAGDYESIDLLVGGTPCQSFSIAGLRGGWAMTVATWRSNFFTLLTDFAPAGWSGRMSPAYCHPTAEGILVPSSEGWHNSGMGGPTECWTLNISEFHSAAVACSLSDILETGAVPQRFFLSAKACAGIIRRAAKRGKTLPPQLARALQGVAGSAPTSTSMAD